MAKATYKVREKLSKKFKGITLEPNLTEGLKVTFSATDDGHKIEEMGDESCGGVFKYSPRYSKEFIENFEYWEDPEPSDTYAGDMLPYQIADTDAFIKNDSIGGITTREKSEVFDTDDAAKEAYLGLFTQKTTKVVVDDDTILYLGKNPEFCQMYGMRADNIYEDGIYEVTAESNIYDEATKLYGTKVTVKLYVKDTYDDDDYAFNGIIDDEEFKKAYEAYPYTTKLVCMGKYVQIEGLDSIIKDYADDEEIAIHISPDFYILTTVGEIRNSPTHGASINMIYAHDTELEDYGYYY